MKRVAIGVLLVLVFSVSAFAADDCLGVARRIWALQNQIVQKSFRGLSPSAWARYGRNLKATYLGKQVSPRTGKELYVIEFSGGFAGQIWYRLVPKDVTYQGKVLRFWTLEPMEAYALMGGKVYYITKAMIEAYFSLGNRKRLSTILEEGTILSPPDCSHVPEVTEISYSLPGGKVVRATVIRSRENGGKLYCSPEVPFGMIKTIASTGQGSNFELVDFGFSGGKAKITRDMVTKTIAAPFIPGGAVVSSPLSKSRK